MRTLALAGAIVMAFIAPQAGAELPASEALYPELSKYITARIAEFDQIPSERKAQLTKLALFVKSRRQAGEPARLTFICTHNSRRSHLSQIWAATAARYYNVDAIESFSGGTEATAFNPRAVAALQRAGFEVEATDKAKNPRYAVRFEKTDSPMLCFSKVYNEAPNPKEDFCAVMTCTQADKSCPIVQGSSLRVALPFEDPKVADNTPEEAARYDERCAQIARELLFVFSQVGK